MTRLLFFPHDIKLPNYINTTRRRRSIGNFHTLRTTTSILAIYALYSLCLLCPFHLIPEVLLSALCSTFETFFNVSRNFHKLPTILKKSKNFLSKIHTHTHTSSTPLPLHVLQWYPLAVLLLVWECSRIFCRNFHSSILRTIFLVFHALNHLKNPSTQCQTTLGVL